MGRRGSCHDNAVPESFFNSRSRDTKASKKRGTIHCFPKLFERTADTGISACLCQVGATDASIDVKVKGHRPALAEGQTLLRELLQTTDHRYAHLSAGLADGRAGPGLSQRKRDRLIRKSFRQYLGTPLLPEMCPKLALGSD